MRSSRQGSKPKPPFGARWAPSPCELINQGLPKRKGRVYSRCCEASSASTQGHGRPKDHEETRGVFESKKRPCLW